MFNAKKNIGLGVAIIVSLVIIFIGIIGVQINNDKISQNVYVNNINISGLTKDEAQQRLKEKFNISNIELVYNNEIWNINSKDIDATYDIENTVKKAYDINRDSNFLENLIATLKSYFGTRNDLNLILDYNKDKLKEELEVVSEDINVDVKNASININGSNISVNDDKEGLNLNIETNIKNIVKNLENNNYNIKLSVDVVEPSIKSDELKEVDTLLGTYTTKFNSSVSGRTENIKLATSRTSNVLLMPGDSFSYNEKTGKRTTQNGYKDAPVIVQGVIQEGVGGGVCQVSTTLYNAVMYAGLEIVSMRNHSIPSSYAEKGRDAAVSDGSIDFVFKNNLKYPVYVRNYVSGNTVTCQIYGSSKDKQNIQISTNIDSTSKAPIKKVDDPSIKKGEEKVLEKARDGYTVSTYRLYKDSNGNLIKKEKVTTSYYPKKQGVIAVGTKEEVVEEEITEENQNPQAQEPVEDNQQVDQQQQTEENNQPQVQVEENLEVE